MRKLFLLLIILIIPFNTFAMKPVSEYFENRDLNSLHYIMSRCAAIYNVYGKIFGSRSNEMKQMTLEGATTFIVKGFELMPEDTKFTTDRVSQLTKEYEKISEQNNRNYGSVIKGVIEVDMASCRLLKDKM